MSGRTCRRMWAAVIAFDTLVLIALLAIGTFGTLHHETGYYDDGPTPERTLVSLWILWGLIPGFLVTAAASFAGLMPSSTGDRA